MNYAPEPSYCHNATVPGGPESRPAGAPAVADDARDPRYRGPVAHPRKSHLHAASVALPAAAILWPTGSRADVVAGMTVGCYAAFGSPWSWCPRWFRYSCLAGWAGA